MTFAGTILALGGREFGNGGFVETSGKSQLNFTGNVDTRAPNGKGGTLLLDPADLHRSGTARRAGFTITNTALQTQLASNNVIDRDQQRQPVGQNGDIFVNAPVVVEHRTTLTLNAFRDVRSSTFAGGPGTIVNTGAGNLVIHADSTGTGNGTDRDAQSGDEPAAHQLVRQHRHSDFLLQSRRCFGTQDQFHRRQRRISCLVTPSQFTAYMLVNNRDQSAEHRHEPRAAITRSRKDINASSIPNFTPIGGAGSPYHRQVRRLRTSPSAT